MSILHAKPKPLTATLFVALAAASLTFTPRAVPQHTALDQQVPSTPHRTRLILKDGSFQIVMSYQVVGNMVRYISAERGGAEEEVPLRLVDLDATHKWEQKHTPSDPHAPTIDPELLKEEADRAALTPEVVKDLRLPEEAGTLALDTFHGTPELVPLAQTDSDLNRNTGHNLLRAGVNPLSAAHQLVQLKNESSPIQLHVKDPVFYLRVGDETVGSTAGKPLVVDTHGATSLLGNEPTGGSPNSQYVILRSDVRTNARIVNSFRINLLGTGQRQEDVVETATELLPGGHWLKVTPKEPLDFGEFALMEVISDKYVNLSVWDFGIHPVAPENRDVLKPDPRHAGTLERRKPD
jgi:hypothetical protein